MAPPHNRVLPSRKVRPPVGVPPAEVTAAVKVSAAPPVEGLLLEARVVRVVARVTAWVRAAVLGPKFASPP